MLVVIDTNILVSSLWSKHDAPARVMGMVLKGILIPCYDYRILNEYREVLLRPKFGFSEYEVNALLHWIQSSGYSIIPDPIAEVFVDEEDKNFYEVAKFCQATLVTGNKKHFPADPLVVTASEFLDEFA